MFLEFSLFILLSLAGRSTRLSLKTRKHTVMGRKSVTTTCDKKMCDKHSQNFSFAEINTEINVANIWQKKLCFYILGLSIKY